MGHRELHIVDHDAVGPLALVCLSPLAAVVVEGRGGLVAGQNDRVPVIAAQGAVLGREVGRAGTMGWRTLRRWAPTPGYGHQRHALSGKSVTPLAAILYTMCGAACGVLPQKANQPIK